MHFSSDSPAKEKNLSPRSPAEPFEQAAAAGESLPTELSLQQEKKARRRAEAALRKSEEHITERKNAEMELKRRSAHQQFIIDLDQRLSVLRQPEDIEQMAVDSLGQYLGGSRCYLAQVGPERARIEREYRADAGSVAIAGDPRFAGPRFADPPAAAAPAQDGSRPLFAVADVFADPHTAGSAGAYAELGIRAFALASVFHQGELVATVTVAAGEVRTFRRDEQELLRDVATRVYPMMERARAEAALRASEARLAATFAALPVGVGLMDADGRLVFANREMQSYLPSRVVPSREPRADPPRWRAWHPDGSPVDMNDFPGARALRGETVVPGMEMLFTNDEGREIWTQVSTVPIREDEEGIAGAATVIIDIDALTRAKEQLRKADQRKNEFLAMLGHELRNPLAAVEGGVKLLQSPRARPESREATLPIVAQQVAHMKRLIDDVLDLARLDRGKLQVHLVEVDLDATLRASIEMVAPLAAGKQSRIRYQPPAEKLRLRADAERLVQVFANLLANALKFSPEGSVVDLWVEPGEQAVVKVRDYGSGIAAENLAEIFEPFVQSKLSLGMPDAGLGLGLAVSRELTELHGGSITAASAGLQHGSTFVVSLPLTHPPS